MDDDFDNTSDIEWEDVPPLHPASSSSSLAFSSPKNPAVRDAVKRCLERGVVAAPATNIDVYEVLKLAAEKRTVGVVLGVATVILKEIEFQWTGAFTQRTHMEHFPIRDAAEHQRFDNNRNRLESYVADASFAKSVAFHAEVLMWLGRNHFPRKGTKLAVHRYVQRVVYDRSRLCKDAACMRRHGYTELELNHRMGHYVCKKCGLVDSTEDASLYHADAPVEPDYESDREEELEKSKRHARKYRDTEPYKRSLYLQSLNSRVDKAEERHSLGDESFLALERARVIGRVIIAWASGRDARLNAHAVEERLTKLFQSAYEMSVANAKAVNRVRQLAVLCTIKSIRDGDSPEVPMHTLHEFAERSFVYTNSSRAKVRFSLPSFVRLQKIYADFLASIGIEVDLTHCLIEETLYSMLHGLGYTPSGEQKDNFYRVVFYWDKKAKAALRTSAALQKLAATRDPKVFAAAILYRALNSKTKKKHPWPEVVVQKIEAMFRDRQKRDIDAAFSEFYADDNAPGEPAPDSKQKDAFSEAHVRLYKGQLDRDGGKKVYFKIFWLHVAFHIHKSRIWPVINALPAPGLFAPNTGTAAVAAVASSATFGVAAKKPSMVKLFVRNRRRVSGQKKAYAGIKRSIADLFTDDASDAAPPRAKARTVSGGAPLQATVLQNIVD